MQAKFVIKGARLIDGLALEPISSSIVVVGADGRITAVGEEHDLDIAKGIPAIDATGMTIMPGLIDGHQHLTMDKTVYAVHSAGQQAAPLHERERQLVRASHFAQTALAAGVTTLRDCGADDFSVLALRDMINAGEFVGPRVLACGRPITTTAGHIFTDWGADNANEVKKSVRFLASKHVDFIKLVVSGGTTTPGTNITRSQYTMDEARTAVEDAHRLGLPVAAHAISTDSIRISADAGVDTIEHCSWIGNDPKKTVTDKEAVEMMLRNRVRVDHAIIPRPYLFPDEGNDAPSNEEQWWLDMLSVRWPFLHYMQKQGVTVFLGTDAAHGPWPGTSSWPGFQDLARAIEIMVRWAKFTPMEAILMATRDAARALRLDHEIGTIEPGKCADMILLSGDPLADTRALRSVEMVFRSGTLVAQRGQIALEATHRADGAPRSWELPV